MAEQTTPSAGDIIAEFLQDPVGQDAFAVAAQEGNTLATEGFGKDLQEMSYAQLLAKYGRDVAENRFRYSDGTSRLRAHESVDPSLVDQVKDTALDAVASLYGIAGNTVGALTVRPMAYAFGVDPDAAAAMNAELTDYLVQETRSKRSDYANDNSYYQSIMMQLDSQDNMAEAKRRVKEEGQTPFMASLQMAGENFLDIGSNIIRDPEALREIVAGSLGSLAPSAALARGSALAATKGVGVLTSSVRAASIAKTAAIATAVGATEASGTYANVMNEVMAMDVDTLVQSPVYAALLEEGYTAREAKIELANLSAEAAFRNQLPAAMALSLLTSKFEAAPIGAFQGAGVVSGLRTVVIQGLEETGQSFSGAVSTNLAIQDNVDSKRDTFQGAGEAAVQGLIGGLGQAGIIGGISAVPTIPQAAVDAANALYTAGERTYNDPLRQEIMGQDGLGTRAINAASNVVNATVQTGKSTAEAVSPVIAPVVDAVRERATAPDTQGQNEAIQAARNTVVGVQEAVDTGQASPEFEAAISQPDTTPTPEGSETSGSFLQDVVAMTERLADRSFKPTDAQKAYAANQYSKLRGMIKDAPQSVRRQIQNLVNSPQARKVSSEVKELDLNTTQTVETPITQDTISTTVSVAKTNPANVNPEVVTKILKESGENISDADVRIMEGASRIASVVNNHRDQQVTISRDRIVGLEKIGRKTTEAPLSQEAASRSLRVEGYQDRQGHDLRSINDFASDIFQGVQSVDGTVINREGQSVPVQQVMGQFQNLVEHMTNKVMALNDSFLQNNEKNRGPLLGFRGLIDGTRFVEADQYRNPVAYHRGNPNSVRFAKLVANDQKAAVEVFNEIRNTFPEHFGSLPEAFAVELLQDEGGVRTKEDIAAEIAAQEAVEIAAAELDASLQVQSGEVLDIADSLIDNEPTAIDEEAAPQETASEEQNQQTEGNPDNTVVTDESPEQPSVDANEEVVNQQTEEEGVVPETSTESIQNETETKTVYLTNKPQRNIHKSFDETYQELDSVPVVESFDDYVEKATAARVNPKVIDTARKLVGPLVKDMNKRLQERMFNKKVKLVDALKTGEVQYFRDYRNTAIVDVNTGTYDKNLVELATVALVDWMISARAKPASMLDETMQDLGVTLDSVSDEDLQHILHGVDPARTKLEIGNLIQKLWNVRENPDSSLGQNRGIAENIAAEMLTSLSNFTAKGQEFSLIQIAKFKSMKDGKEVETDTLDIRGLTQIQKDVQATETKDTTNRIGEALFGDVKNTYSIGTKIAHVASSQERSGVYLSSLERAALRKMQDTPHYMDQGRVELVAAIGEGISNMLGYVDDPDQIPNAFYRRSVMGKNLSITQDLENASNLVDKLDGPETPVYYPVGVTKVGRHQYQGVNPQSSKILRALVTPTWSDLNFDNKDHMDSFWLGIAQAADLFKVEKLDHDQVLADVKKTFDAKFRPAVDMVKEWLKTGELNGDAFVAVMGVVEMQQLAAVHAVAEMEFSKEAGNESFHTSLSFELDGLTNGAANMMVNYGQGEITQSDFKNFNRIGLFLGKTDKTVNDFFKARGPNGEKNSDLYETTSQHAERVAYRLASKMEKKDQDVMMAAFRFAAFFGDFKMNEDGSVEMTRNTAKNPMTKVNYGSGVKGVGDGIADSMLLEFYKQIQNIPDNANYAEYFGYPTIQQDINILFGNTLPTSLGNGAFEFPNQAIELFRKKVGRTIGEVLTQATKEVIGDRITELNDMLVFSTNVQSQYLQLIFDERLEALAEKRAKEGKVRRTPQGKPQLADLSVRDYQSVVRDLQQMAPIFVSDDQTLAIGGFSRQRSKLELSSAMDGRLRQPALLPAPEDVGVKAIPFSVIGSGDAMMMNFIFGSEGAPNDVLGIFDGLDVPVAKVKEYAPYVNQQVLKTWERDVLAMAVQNYSGFLTQVRNDPKLSEAFQIVKDKSKKTSVVASNPEELMVQLDQRHKENQARKSVLKRIPLSVDQMGGSDVGFSRGEGELGLSAINYEIQKELEGRSQKEEVVNIDIQETTADAVLKGLRLTADQKKVAEILKPMMKNVRVIIGTLDQINTYRQENFADDGQILEGNAQYDAGNGIIFTTTTQVSTILHEMVHAGTFDRVLNHYNGNANPAVVRLEALMNEFMLLETSGKGVNEAKAAILRHQAQNDPASKAAAVNEFMAYALSNAGVKKVLKFTETKTLATIARKVVELMRRIMGGIPVTMFDHVVFNTKVLNEPPIDDGGDGNGDDGSSNGENTPPADNYTNFWIELIKNYIQETRDQVGQFRQSARPIKKFSDDADAVIDGFRQVGMLSNNNARKTFKAIYMVMAAEMKMDPNTVISLTRIFQHIEENLVPEQFGTGSEANQEYSAVINSFGKYKTGEISNAVAVLLGLSQTSAKFRAVLDQIPTPEGTAQQDGSLSSFLSQIASGLMRKVTGSINTADQSVLQTMDNLAASLIDIDQQREFTVLSGVTNTLDKMDSYVSGKMSELSGRVQEKNREIQNSTRSNVTKTLANMVTLGTNLLDKYSSEQTADAAKRVTHMNVPILSMVPIRELVSEVIGTDRTNKPLVALMDEVNSRISGMRQAYREDLPGILQNLFDVHPNEEQWASMHRVLGQTDFTRFVDVTNMQQSMALLEESSRRRKRIQDLEAALDVNLLPYIAQDAKDKAQQLADYMNGKGAGKLLARNAYAIVKNLDGNFEEAMVPVVDELVSMYVIDQMDPDVREETVQLWQNEPKAITGLVTYIQGLNEAEDGKPGISEQARLNAYKGFIPNHGDKDTRVIIDKDENAHELEKRGYTKLGSFEGDVDSIFPRSYFVTTTRQGGTYSQGIMQNVQSTYRGVDINTGLTVTGETSGYISGDGTVERIVEEMNRTDFQLSDLKETLLPVFDEDGTVAGFERTISPDVYKAHMRQDENLAVMLGAWAGRHVEELLADQYNHELVDHLDRIWQEREDGTDDLFVNLKKTTDPIYRESFRLIPQGTKNYMDGKFDGDGPMVRKDMANLSVGYREASLADMWSGKTRLPKELQQVVVNTSQFLLGKKAMKYLATGEQIIQGAVSTAKDIIVIRSLVVPMANTKSNVIQLATRGVPTKQIYRGFRSKLAEVEEYNKNVTKRIELEAQLRLAARDANQKRIIQAKIDVIDDLNSRMTIAPMIAVGAYKNLSEGITDLDVDISKGRLGDIVESLADRLPDRIANVAKLGLVSKSTKIYQVANRATQYGDFLAKSIYYDHLISQGLSEEDAIAKMNEEFVNFSLLPGRTRSYLETVGLTWFMAFKIRIAKIALQQLRENPLRALAINNALPDIGSPIQDNIFSVAVEGRLDYSTGYEMLLDAPSLNPWVNLLNN